MRAVRAMSEDGFPMSIAFLLVKGSTGWSG